MKRKVLLVPLLLAGLCCFGLQAGPISGSFELDGSVTVSATTISWSSQGGAGTAFLTGATGAYAAANNSFIDITTLTNPPDLVGQKFTDTAFITFPSAPSLGALDINFIFTGVDSTAGCAATPPAAGQMCTPPITQNGSTVPGPFNMQNNPGTNGPQATITWSFAGDAINGGSVGGTWNGNFTSQTNVPFQTLLAQLGSSGSVTETFSESTMVVAVSSVPEGGTFALVGLGLVVFSRGLARMGKKRTA